MTATHTAAQSVASARTLDLALCDWFPVGGSLLVSKLSGFYVERGAAGTVQLFAAKQRSGVVSFFWSSNGALFSEDFSKSAVGHYADKSAVRRVCHHPSPRQ